MLLSAWLSKSISRQVLNLLILKELGKLPSENREIREFKIITTATATGTSLNKRFNEQNNSCARAL